MPTPVYSVYVPLDDKQFKSRKVRRIPGRYDDSLAVTVEKAAGLAKKEQRPAYIIEYGDAPEVIGHVTPAGEYVATGGD